MVLPAANGNVDQHRYTAGITWACLLEASGLTGKMICVHDYNKRKRGQIKTTCSVGGVMYLGGDARPQQWFSVGGDVCPSGDTGPCLESCLVVCMGEMHRTPPPTKYLAPEVNSAEGVKQPRSGETEVAARSPF